MIDLSNPYILAIIGILIPVIGVLIYAIPRSGGKR